MRSSTREPCLTPPAVRSSGASAWDASPLASKSGSRVSTLLPPPFFPMITVSGARSNREDSRNARYRENNKAVGITGFASVAYPARAARLFDSVTVHSSLVSVSAAGCRSHYIPPSHFCRQQPFRPTTGSVLVNARHENEKAGPVGPFAKRTAAVCRSPALEKIFTPCFQAVRPVHSSASHSAPATLKSKRGLRPPRRPQQSFLAGQQALLLRWY